MNELWKMPALALDKNHRVYITADKYGDGPPRLSIVLFDKRSERHLSIHTDLASARVSDTYEFGGFDDFDSFTQKVTNFVRESDVSR